jgi:hypothetical protein
VPVNHFFTFDRVNSNTVIVYVISKHIFLDVYIVAFACISLGN